MSGMSVERGSWVLGEVFHWRASGGIVGVLMGVGEGGRGEFRLCDGSEETWQFGLLEYVGICCSVTILCIGDQV